jgi:DNA-binding transcriptional regulator YdaS (Cro superfamily)
MAPNCDDATTLLRSVREVVDLLNGTNATAEELGVRPPTVSYWLSNGCFPPGRYLAISAAVEARGHRVDRSLFRETPDMRKSEAEDAA